MINLILCILLFSCTFSRLSPKDKVIKFGVSKTSLGWIVKSAVNNVLDRINLEQFLDHTVRNDVLSRLGIKKYFHKRQYTVAVVNSCLITSVHQQGKEVDRIPNLFYPEWWVLVLEWKDDRYSVFLKKCLTERGKEIADTSRPVTMDEDTCSVVVFNKVLLGIPVETKELESHFKYRFYENKIVFQEKDIKVSKKGQFAKIEFLEKDIPKKEVSKLIKFVFYTEHVNINENNFEFKSEMNLDEIEELVNTWFVGHEKEEFEIEKISIIDIDKKVRVLNNDNTLEICFYKKGEVQIDDQQLFKMISFIYDSFFNRNSSIVIKEEENNLVRIEFLKRADIEEVKDKWDILNANYRLKKSLSNAVDVELKNVTEIFDTVQGRTLTTHENVIYLRRRTWTEWFKSFINKENYNISDKVNNYNFDEKYYRVEYISKPTGYTISTENKIFTPFYRYDLKNFIIERGRCIIKESQFLNSMIRDRRRFFERFL